VLDPLPKKISSATVLPAEAEAALKEVITSVLGPDGDASKRSKAGDHQGALQLVLGCLYSRKENKFLQAVTPNDVLKRLGDVIGEIISRVISTYRALSQARILADFS